MDDIAYEWEMLTGVKLGFDPIITKIYQKDVNNYLFINEFGEVEAKGVYVKSLSTIDNDLPIVNKALREFMINGTPVEVTVHSSDSLLDFQKIVKLSSAYECVRYNGRTYTNKCYRVFASRSTLSSRKMTQTMTRSSSISCGHAVPWSILSGSALTV